MIISGSIFRRGLPVLFLFAVSVFAEAAECSNSQEVISGATGSVGRVVSRFRIGPFYEQARMDSGACFWAVRPFYSRFISPHDDTSVTDVLWPLGTGHQLHRQRWWRAGLAYGSNDDVDNSLSSRTWNLFPLWYSGRTRQGEDYWALFPVYGHLPHTLFVLDDVDFTLFPLYLDYEVNHVERRYWLWPFFSKTGEQPGVSRSGVFPFYGHAEHRGRNEGTTEKQRYVLWPFWTSAEYDDPENAGGAWMLWPLCGRVNRAKEKQRLFLPPFFSYTETDSATRWRLPWPLYETVDSPRETRRSFWPFYGDTRRVGERKQYILGPLVNWFTLKAGPQTTSRFYFFPFYLSQSRTVESTKGKPARCEKYTRFWPFYSCEKRADGSSHTRALDLLPIRSASGFERNWSPYWTFYNRQERDGDVRIDLFWGLIKINREVPVPREEKKTVPTPVTRLPVEPLLSDWEFVKP